MSFRYWFTTIGIALIHLFVVLALWLGPTQNDWLIFFCVYPFAAIGVGIAMHRYFAHKAFVTSRLFRFVLALCACLAFGNAVHFAGKHRFHHRFADREGDVHAPHQGFWQCWINSLIDCGYSQEQIEAEVTEYLSSPELRYLYRFSMVPCLLLCTGLFLWGGFTTMAIGGLLSPLLLLHQSSAVNYCCHRWGQRPYRTVERSTNNILVALLTYGEGWHNNHHKFPRSAQAGLHWWQLDIFYLIICSFEVTGLVWDVRRINNRRIEAAK